MCCLFFLWLREEFDTLRLLVQSMKCVLLLDLHKSENVFTQHPKERLLEAK
jgi:hypothetical protein